MKSTTSPRLSKSVCIETITNTIIATVFLFTRKFTHSSLLISERIYQPPPPNSLIWIVIGTAIGLFLLLLIFICCIVCQLTKGDEYDGKFAYS